MSEQFSECKMTSSRGSFKANSFEMNEFPNQPLKEINSAFDKISLLFQTVLESEARSLLPTVQLLSHKTEKCRFSKSFKCCNTFWSKK